jgi:hypothetical protein
MNYFPVIVAILLLSCSTFPGGLQAQSGRGSVSNVDESAGESEEFFEFLDRVTQKKRGPFGRPKLFTRTDKGQISELRLRGVKLQEGDLAIAGALRHLERLDLSDSNVQDMQLIQLADCPNILRGNGRRPWQCWRARNGDR